MKFPGPALLASVLIPAEGALQASRCILRPNKTRDANPIQKSQTRLESLTGGVMPPASWIAKYGTKKEGSCVFSIC